MELKDTKAYIRKDVSGEIRVRAAKLVRPRSDLFRLLAVMPFKELKELIDKYLSSH